VRLLHGGKLAASWLGLLRFWCWPWGLLALLLLCSLLRELRPGSDYYSVDLDPPHHCGVELRLHGWSRFVLLDLRRGLFDGLGFVLLLLRLFGKCCFVLAFGVLVVGRQERENLSALFDVLLGLEVWRESVEPAGHQVLHPLVS